MCVVFCAAWCPNCLLSVALCDVRWLLFVGFFLLRVACWLLAVGVSCLMRVVHTLRFVVHGVLFVVCRE